MSRPTRRAVVATLGAAAAGGLAGAVPARATASVPRQAGAPAEALPVTAEGSGSSRVPLRRAHAHNDYEHEHPLADALRHRFTSVEADVWLVGGELLVGHERDDLHPDRTLESLYLEPLLRRVTAQHGSVYAGHTASLQLLVDIKNSGAAAYQELHRRLRRYRSILSSASGGKARIRAVTPVVSGDRAVRAPMEAQRHRYAFYDGRLDDLGTRAPAAFLSLISADWASTFDWTGEGAMPADERGQLRDIVDEAHTHGRRVRFWGTPDAPGPERDALWHELVAAGVDHINTDDLAGLERFLSTFDRAWE
ncbi:phosphatidylinositol-specific phospholipase C/glycerophosphodiester phosphodiesterase family protein [Streptomyces sp. NPDC002055]|uniref:phosphatidylinositol-specific phospholipase C/glycerophosphodiester phosphodiesterase family protein n=1 Tax=Streptomyces sp. NPDC002055 TaxID=3154534 RepID=UPI003320720D